MKKILVLLLLILFLASCKGKYDYIIDAVREDQAEVGAYVISYNIEKLENDTKGYDEFYTVSVITSDNIYIVYLVRVQDKKVVYCQEQMWTF